MNQMLEPSRASAYAEKAERLFNESVQLMEMALQARALHILRNDPTIAEFVVSMGAWTAVDSNGRHPDSTDERLELFAEMADRYETCFGASYGPWRLKSDGIVVTDW